MLGQIELGHSAPTVTVLGKVSQALGVAFTTLLAGAPKATVIRASPERAQVGRRLSGHDIKPKFEELSLEPNANHVLPAEVNSLHNVVVFSGEVTFAVGVATHELSPGDAVVLDAAQPISLRSDAGAIVYVVTSDRE